MHAIMSLFHSFSNMLTHGHFYFWQYCVHKVGVPLITQQILESGGYGNWPLV